MSQEKFREIYAPTGDGGVQFAASADRWHLYEDIHVEKVRMNGFFGTHLDQVLRTQGIETLFFAGVNIDQCVTSTVEEAYFRDYNAVLLEDACATSSPDDCQDAVVFDARNCWGFSMTTAQFAAATPYGAEGMAEGGRGEQL